METIAIIADAIGIFASKILVHELRHFIAAKLVGIKVITVSVVYGKRHWKKKIGEITSCISSVSLGG
jgi:regulator of sigma E protease